MLKSYSPPPPHSTILFELDFNIKFPLLHLLKFPSDLKRTIVVLFLASKPVIITFTVYFINNSESQFDINSFLPLKYFEILEYLDHVLVRH